MYDLKDTTFTIPVRIDHPKRKECLFTIVRYLQKYFNTSILIGEESPERTLTQNLGGDCRIYHFKSENKWFHRTKILNDLAKLSETPIVVNYDADVLFLEEQYIKGIESLRGGKASAVLPYGGKCLDVPSRFHADIQKNLNLDSVRPGQCHCTNPHALGGAIFWSKKAFLSFGMENEHFISWGYEDNERIERIKKLGVKLIRIPGNLYHLSHPRSFNSVENHLSKENEKEFYKIRRMPSDVLRKYIKTWFWIKE